MKYAKIIVLFYFIFGGLGSAFSQGKESPGDRNPKSDRSQINNVKQPDLKQPGVNEPVPDFKIIASTQSYIEIEFIPQYSGTYDLLNASSELRKAGLPDLKVRSFPLFLPVDNNNRIEILDYKYEDVSNIDVPPVPVPRRSNKDMEVFFDLKKDDKAYNTNAFFPSSPAALNVAGVLRNKYMGYAAVSPVMYNPASRTIRKYSYIRFRVTFGGNPIVTNKILSKEELGFFSGMTLNSDIALNWSTKEFNSSRDNSSLISSVLSSGDFYKIEIKETGMYKLDKNFLQGAGINLAGVDPKTIKIYGNGGKELPYNNSTLAPTDLIQNRIHVVGEDNNVFDDGDYIVFYGKSPHDWNYDSQNRVYNHYINHYSNSNYYFITFGGSQGVRMNINASPNSSVPQLTSFTDRMFEEPEVNNLGSTGNLWLATKIGQGQEYNFGRELPGYVNNTEIDIRLRYGNGSASSNAVFNIRDDNAGYSVFKDVFPVTGGEGFSHINLVSPFETLHRYSIGSNNSLNLRLWLPADRNPSNSAGYLDYFEAHYNRNLGSVQNNYIRIFAPDTSGTLEYNVSPFNTSDLKVFDVTEDQNPSIITPLSINGGVVRFQADHTPGTPEQFYVVGSGNYKSPASISSKIANQDIHGVSAGASFVIFSPTEFLPAANRLKAHRENTGQFPINTMVLDINQVYNEFSGGLLDPVAIRNFLKYAFNNWQERPVYVMFMGDGTYDYKNLYNQGTKNYLPPIQKTTDDINEISSFPSDDFATDIDEAHNEPVPAVPDFAAGRLCVNSLNDANTVIDKIETYESPSSNGIWKKKIMYVADDGWTTSNPGGEGNMHVAQSETIAELRTPKDFEKEKVYIVAYPTVITPQGRRKPGANVDIIKGWTEGRLVINYVGHGSTDLWAHEQIFERQSSIPQINNKGKYPIVTIASCDLARYDDPFFTSAAEELVNIKDKGGIAVIAAVRPVYSAPNAAFNEELWLNFMNKKDSLNLPIRLGTGMYNTKFIQNPSDNNAKFTLLGDPTIRTAIPQYFTKIDSINNTPGNEVATIKALQKVRISGSILRTDSTFWSDYNGSINIKIFDVDRVVNITEFNNFFSFRLDGGKIFNGKADVVNGKWILEFVVPKDISYNTGNGKLIAYFNNASSDGSGYTNNFILNGLDTSAVVDTTGPQISVYMGDRNFRSGDVVNQNTKIVADFFDNSGINLTGTIGHKIEAVMNGDENNKIDLTPFYNSTSNFQNGTLEHALQNLADGNYTLKLVAWDTYNNVSSASIDFKVMNSSQLAVQKVYNYPNPMMDNTSFLFQHNFDDPLNVKVKIYTVSGRLIKELNKSNITDKFVQIDWDGRDNDGDAIANGTYIYKVVINSEDGSFSTNSTGKLAKLK